MKTLIEKEIRLLLPAFAAALVLAIVSVWLIPLHEPWKIDPWGPTYLHRAYPYLLGSILLALSSFGREIGLRTLPFALAQPFERARIWRIKITVLAVLMAVVFGVWLISGGSSSSPLKFPAFIGLFAIVCMAFALWLTLLLRETVAAFLLTLLVPPATLTAISALGGTLWMMAATFCLYAVIGFFLARRQFFHVQDTAWTGGVISFGGRSKTAERSSLPERGPWAALLGKEVRLQQVTLAGMVCLLLLHAGAVLLRNVGAHTFGKTTLFALESFGWLWLIVPVIAGSQTVAEERQIGTLDSLLCLPVSRRIQFFVKLIFVLVVGALLSASLLCAVERIGAAPNHGSPMIAGVTLDVAGVITVFFFFLAVSMLSFYASTLTRGMVPAIGMAAVMVIGFWLSLDLARFQQVKVSDFVLWQGILVNCIGWPVMAATLVWLSYRNFGIAFESPRMWRRNVLALASALAVIFGLSTAIYHRAWEWLTPMEPSHGPPRMSVEKPPALHSYGGRGLAAVLPDGRLWVGRLGEVPRWHFRELYFGGRWRSLGRDELLPGSNWVDAVANSRETVAIRSDGTLWVSETPQKVWEGAGLPPVQTPAGLVQFGHDTNWQSIARFPDWAMFLLKRDGTLWEWGTNSINLKQRSPSLRDFEPRRLGKDADWARLLGSRGWNYAYVWKKDGSAWALHDPRGWDPEQGHFQDGQHFSVTALEPWWLVFARQPAFDHSRWRNVEESLNSSGLLTLREDGTLWFFDWSDPRTARTAGLKLVQIGKDSDWTAFASLEDGLVARKTDGTLWKWVWEFENYRPYRPNLLKSGPSTPDLIRSIYRQSLGRALLPLATFQKPPIRLGTHSDWVGLGGIGGQVLSLAADGNLSIWPGHWPTGIGIGFGRDWDMGILLAPSRKPAKIENIFSAGE